MRVSGGPFTYSLRNFLLMLHDLYKIIKALLCVNTFRKKLCYRYQLFYQRLLILTDVAILEWLEN